MGRIKKWLLCFWCWLPLWTLAQAEELDVKTDSLQQEATMESIRLEDGVDSPVIAAKSWAHDSLLQLRNDPAFGYMHYADSLLRSRYKTIPDDTPQKKETPAWDFTWLEWIWWIAAASALLFVVYRLAVNAGFVRRNTPRKADEIPASLDALNGHGTEHQLQAAIQKGDYRLAVRLQFLLLLHQLRERQLITEAPGKTNRQYLYDLQDTSMRKDLASLMLPYEYVWYGGFELQPQQFHQIREQYLKFQSQWFA